MSTEEPAVVPVRDQNNPPRPYVRRSDDTHPFSNVEALYTAVTNTAFGRDPLTGNDFPIGDLDRLAALTRDGHLDSARR